MLSHKSFRTNIWIKISSLSFFPVPDDGGTTKRQERITMSFYYITLIIVFLSHTLFHTERFAEGVVY